VAVLSVAIVLVTLGTAGFLWAQQGQPGMKMPMASPAAKAKGDAARKAILEHQKSLRAEKVYDCCIRPGCAFCSTAADMCPCAMNLSQGQPVCPECWGGWFAGKGRLPGVEAGPNARNIHVLPQNKMKMMYDTKEMGMRKAAEATPQPASPPREGP